MLQIDGLRENQLGELKEPDIHWPCMGHLLMAFGNVTVRPGKIRSYSLLTRLRT